MLRGYRGVGVGRGQQGGYGDLVEEKEEKEEKGEKGDGKVK